MVSNVPLVKQQADAIRRDSGVEVIEICGASKTKKHQESVWTEIAESAQVVVITAQILLDALRQGYWHMSRVSISTPLLVCCYQYFKDNLRDNG